MVTDTVEEMLTLRHPTQHHLSFIEVAAIKKKCNYSLEKINEFEPIYGFTQSELEVEPNEEVKEKWTSSYKKVMVEGGNSSFTHKLKVVGRNQRAIGSFESHIFKYIRELQKKIGFLELSEYEASESESKESESLDVKYQSTSKEWKKIGKRLSYEKVKTEETLSFSKQFNVVLEITEKEDCLVISVYSNSRSAQKLAMAELSLRFRLQHLVKM